MVENLVIGFLGDSANAVTAAASADIFSVPKV